MMGIFLAVLVIAMVVVFALGVSGPGDPLPPRAERDEDQEDQQDEGRDRLGEDDAVTGCHPDTDCCGRAGHDAVP